MKKKGGANVASENAPATDSSKQTPPNPNSKRTLRKKLAIAEGKTPKAKAKVKGQGNVAAGECLVSSGALIKGGVLGMLATGASAMCERPRSVDDILTRLSAIPGCVECTSLLDSFVENGTFANISLDREDQTSPSPIARPQEQNLWKGGACMVASGSQQTDQCSNIGWNGPCCFVGLDLNVKGGK